MPAKFQSVDQYISTFPPATRKALKDIRSAIKKAAPGAEEAISYNIPAFKLDGMLVWYAGYKEHIGLYPRPNVIQLFKKELTGYKLSKGTIQFPLDQPLPIDLITRIVKYRIAENQAAAATRSNPAGKRQTREKIKPAGKRQTPAKTKKSKIK
ncbi:MAG: DUF1801 domain-containing protein [Bacteroidetes bacterium]|nr:DUF1801 domain-containing protein [Bacteroidota bacterium]